jgi:hypothetical protein
MELITKAADAASMFWQALDSRERMLVGYAAAWLAFYLLVSAQHRSRERLKAELREELAASAA